MGFAEDVETILKDTPDDKQVALFSATMPAQIRRISKQYLNDPEEITVKNKTTTSVNTSQRYLLLSYPQKVDALTRILEVENFEGMIVFTRTKNETELLAEKLRARGYSAAAINGDVQQVQRERTVNQLKSGKLDILVATDVAARGLDVERISHVINYDIPIDTESYVHRIGRTGRDQGRGNSRDERGDRGDRPVRSERPVRSTGKPMAQYRIEVGKRHKVEPRQIVGALANEGGLSRDDFGHIKIQPDFSLVELPADLSNDVFSKLASTRISGKLIELRADRGGAGRQDDRPPRKSYRD